MATALTREQKLLAEIVVQLGNITEAIKLLLQVKIVVN